MRSVSVGNSKYSKTSTGHQQKNSTFSHTECICIYFCQQPGQGHLNSACSTETQTLMLVSPLVYRRWDVLLLTMPLNFKSLEAGKDEKLNVKALECFKKGIGRLWDHLTPSILAKGKKLALFPWIKYFKKHSERYSRWGFHTQLSYSPLVFHVRGLQSKTPTVLHRQLQNKAAQCRAWCDHFACYEN